MTGREIILYAIAAVIFAACVFTPVETLKNLIDWMIGGG